MATKKKTTDCRQYRIGDFARYLGVTSEFLKHYQESGLIDVNQRASGYRYYGFDQSGRILQYMRLRNYGMTLTGRTLTHLDLTNDHSYKS